MTEKNKFAPLTKELLRPDFQERVKAAFTGPKAAPSAETQGRVAGWSYVLVIGEVQEVLIEGDDHFVIKIQGWWDYQNIYEGEVRRSFRFRMPQDDFLAEARRSQSDGLYFSFQCYLTVSTEPLDTSPLLLVQQIEHYSVWGRPYLQVDLSNRLVQVNVTNKLLDVGVKAPTIGLRDGLVHGGDPIAVADAIYPLE